MSKLSDKDVKHLRNLRKAGWLYGQLAELFGITKGYARSIVKFKSRQYVADRKKGEICGKA